MPVPQDLRPARRRSLTPYVWIWVSVGTAALAYLVLLGTQPELMARLSQQASTERVDNSQQRDLTRAVADIEPMRQTVGQLRMDVAKIKSVVEENFKGDKIVEQRLSVVEQTISIQNPAEQTTGEAPGSNSPQKSASVQPTVLNAQQQNQDSLETSSISRSGSTANATATDVIETAAITQKQVETVVVPTPVRKPKVPTQLAAASVPAPTSATGVRLAIGPSIAALQLNWRLLSDRNKDAIGHLKPRYTVSGPSNNKTYELVAGPIGTEVQAEIVCSVLSQRGYPCKVGTYSGSALPPPI